MKNKHLFLISFLVAITLFLSGCITNQNQDNFDEDPCGNAVGNGYEIISGPLGPEFEGDRDNPFRTLTVHPTNPDILIVGTERNGFVKSIDGGITWTRFRKGLRHEEHGYPEIYDIGWSVSNPDIIYAVATDGPGPATGNYPSTPAGVYKSYDAGETWIRKNCNLPCSAVLSVHVDPTDENHVFIGIEDGTPSFTHMDITDTFFEGGMYETIDGGETWQEVELGPLDYKNSYILFRSVKNDSSVIVTFGLEDRDYFTNDEGIGFIRSIDGGKTWEEFASELRDKSINYFDISGNGDTIYAVSLDTIYISNNVGDTWTSKEMHIEALYFLAVSPVDEKRVLYGKLADLYLSTDGLETEKKVIDIERVGDKHIADIVFAPSNPQIVYAIYTGAYPDNPGYDLYKSTDAGDSFTRIINLREEVLNIQS